MKTLSLVLVGLSVIAASAFAQDYVVLQPDGTNAKRDQMKAAKFVNGHDARDGKLDGTGPGHGHGHSKAVIVGNGPGNGHGNGKANGKGKGHGKH